MMGAFTGCFCPHVHPEYFVAFSVENQETYSDAKRTASTSGVTLYNYCSKRVFRIPTPHNRELVQIPVQTVVKQVAVKPPIKTNG